MNKFHYVYRITNKIENKHYYGVRSSIDLPVNDLGIKYFSSSHDKEFIKLQKENSSIFKYKVVSVYSKRETAVQKEIKLHNKFNVGVNKNFYNLTKQSSTGFDNTGIKASDYTRKLLSELRTGSKRTEETKEILSQRRRERDKREDEQGIVWTFSRSDEFKQDMSKRKLGKPRSEETKRKISETITGSPAKKPVIIDGIYYSTMKEASIILGILRITVSRRCKSSKYPNWVFA